MPAGLMLPPAPAEATMSYVGGSNAQLARFVPLWIQAS